MVVNQEKLEEYSNSVRRLKQQFLNDGLSEEEFKELYFETLQSLETPRHRNSVFSTRKKYAAILALSVAIILVTVNYKVIYSCLACNLQDYIYPGLRYLRKFFIPIISLFPSLTELYHETCLIQNPFFAVVDMDCWPCSSVNNIREVLNPKPVSQQHNAPFIYKTEQEVISIDVLKNFYISNKNVFDQEAPKILIDNKIYSHPSDVILQHDSDEKHYYIWKFNNMNVAKSLRQLIPRPEVVPKFGQSTERYIIVDTSQEQFQIPDTECNFSFLLSLSGSRTIELKPAEECKHQCKSLKIELKPAYLLWYNWWYWRPIVQSSMGNTTFIAHVGSYC